MLDRPFSKEFQGLRRYDVDVLVICFKIKIPNSILSTTQSYLSITFKSQHIMLFCFCVIKFLVHYPHVKIDLARAYIISFYPKYRIPII